MKESSKKKLARSTWVVMYKTMGMKTDKESTCSQSGGEMEAKKIEIASAVILIVTKAINLVVFGLGKCHFLS